MLEIRLALPDMPVKKDAKTGVVERMNMKMTIATIDDLTGIREGIKKAYSLN